jgi:hypothetical protein
MNKDQQSLQRLESGKVSPSLFYLYEVSKGLEISLLELMNFDIVHHKQKHSKTKI